MTTSHSENPGNYVLSDLSGDVLLIGGYGAGNMGDEAILSGLLAEASKEINKLSVVTHSPENTENLHKSEVHQTVDFQPLSPTIQNLFAGMRKHDHIVVGGGGIFSRYMGPYASKLPYYMITSSLLSKSLRWTAIGVYPSTPTSVMLPLRVALTQSDSVSVRDPVSQNTLLSEGISDVKLVPDPATRLKPDTEAGAHSLEQEGLSLEDNILGVAARRVKNEENNSRLQQTYDQVIESFIDSGWDVVLLPFCQHPHETVEKDGLMCAELQQKYPSAIIPSFRHPETLLGIVNHLDGMVATRLHSMIFAHITDTPFAAVEYAAKCTSLLEHYDKSANGIPLKQVSKEEVLEILDLE